MITVQPIHYTSDPDGWHRFAETIGFRAVFPPVASWSEFDAGGILAIHHVVAGDPLDGTTDIHLLVSDLDSVEGAAVTAGARVDATTLENVGRILTVTLSEVRVTVSNGSCLTPRRRRLRGRDRRRGVQPDTPRLRPGWSGAVDKRRTARPVRLSVARVTASGAEDVGEHRPAGAADALQ